MKRAWAICLMLLFLTAHTSFGQWMRFPVMMKHYVEHCREKPVSLFEFIVAHYADAGHRDHSDHPDHHKLPFKSDQCYSLVFSLAGAPTELAHPPYLPATENKRLPFPQTACSQQCEGNIWQPPRNA